jgi:predicted transcriptional regulator of viral defense system
MTTDQLRRAGTDKSGIGRRVRAGRLHRVHRGVYAVGHEALSLEGCWLAVVLAYGGSAVLSHRSAAELWGFLPPEPATIHVTVASASGRAARRGIRLHRCPSLPRSAMTRRNGIAVTIPARTIGDLRRVAPGSEVRRAIRQAEFLGRGLLLADDGDRAAAVR